MRLIILFLLFGSHCFGQTLNAGRTTNWKKAKHVGTFFEPSLTVNLLNFGGNNTGNVANDAAFTAAVNSLNGKPGIIYLPAGNYLFQNQIILRDSLILRGSGNNTILTFNFNNAAKNCIVVSGTTVGSWVGVTTGLRKSSKWIKPTSTATFKVGDQIEIRQLNGSWDTQPAAWAQYAVGQILFVDSIKNGRLYFHEKLRIAYDTILQPQVARLNTKKNVGIECLKMVRTDGAATSNNYGVFINKAFNCWIKNVTIEKMISAHVCISTSARCEVTGSYFTDAYSFDGSNTHGYGILLNAHACENKIENNVFKKLRHAIVCKQGANGNVIAYNYITQPMRTEFPTDAGADLLLHGHYPFLNLFEGNICQNIQADQTWGPNGPYNTFIRNRADGYGLIITAGSMPTHDQNIIANDITNTGFLKGNYTLTGNNHFEYGNRVKGTVTPANTNNVSINSYYLNQAPGWWTGNTWPTIGLPNAITTAGNPAATRYATNVFTETCIPLAPKFGNAYRVIVFPNPSNGNFTINAPYIQQIAVVDAMGKPCNFTWLQNQLHLEADNGVYFITVWHKYGMHRQALILVK